MNNKLKLTVALPGGLDDLLRAGAGVQNQNTGSVADVNGVTLTAIVVPQGAFMDTGLSISADGKIAFGPVFQSQFTELDRVNAQYLSVGADYLESAGADLTFANGDVVSFDFVQAGQ